MKLPFTIGNRPIQGNFDALTSEATGPRFRAYRNAASSLATSGVVVWDTEEEDSHDYFSTSTGAFTVQRAGVYRFSWAVRLSTVLTADKWMTSFLRRNTTIIKIGTIHLQRGAIGLVSAGSAQVAADIGDAFDVIIQHDNGGTVAISVGNSLNSWFDGEFVGS